MIARLALHGNETVIDAGRGAGRLTAELLAHLPDGHVIAMDRSESMLDAAREHLAPRFGSRVSFVQTDLQSLAREHPVSLSFGLRYRSNSRRSRATSASACSRARASYARFYHRDGRHINRKPTQ